jgi:hypothetical protein
MTILGNASRRCFGPVMYRGGVTALNLGNSMSNKIGLWRHFNFRDGAQAFLGSNAFPSGYNNPQAWLYQITQGLVNGLSESVLSSSASLAAGIGISGQSDGQTSTTANLMAIVSVTGSASSLSSLTGNLSGLASLIGTTLGLTATSCSISALYFIQGQANSSSDAQATLTLVSPISGQATGLSSVSGDLTVVLLISGLADCLSSLNGSLTGVGSIQGSSEGSTTSNLLYDTIIGWLNGQGNGNSEALGSINAKGMLIGSVTTETELSPQSLAKAVWSALADENKSDGTFGKLCAVLEDLNISKEDIADAVWRYTR